MSKPLVFVVVAALGCKAAPHASTADASCAEPVFDAGPAPDSALFVIAEGRRWGSFSFSTPTALLRYEEANETYELRADGLARRPDLDAPTAPGFPEEWVPFSLEPDSGYRDNVIGMAHWKGGSVLRLISKTNRLTSSRFVVDGPAAAPPLADHEAHYDDMIAFPSGEIFATSGGDVLRWPADGSASVIDKLPQRKNHTAPHLKVLYGRSPTDVWAAGSDAQLDAAYAYVAHFDGRVWTNEEFLGPGAVSTITGGPDGSIWLVARELSWREPNGAWTSSSLPSPTDAPPEPSVERRGLRVVGPRDVWIALRYSYRWLVVHSKPGDGVLDLDDGTKLTFAQAAKRWSLPTPWQRR
jgi:hypothetical protein